MNKLLSIVSNTINNESLITSKDKIFVAISGGADSVALLMALHLLGFKIGALHCNFNLRGQESLDDENFVVSLCDKYGIDCRVISFDTIKYSQDNKISIEMAARELRYNWFEKISQENDGALVAIAHNSDDCIETVFLNIASGTGIRGLTGIQYKRNDYIIRPLLNCSRTEIIKFLESINQQFRTDSTNNSIVYKRNFIRHKIIPLFEELNPSFRETMLKTIDVIRFNNSIYLDHITQIGKEIIQDNNILVDKVLLHPFPKEYLMYEILSPYNFNIDTCRDMSNLLERNKYCYNKTFLSSSHKIITFGKIWQLMPKELPNEQEIILDVSRDGFVDFSVGVLNWEITRFEPLEKNDIKSNIAIFDYDKIIAVNNKLIIRNRKDADYIKPLGMNGKKKKVSRILIDNKLTPIEKLNTRLLTIGDEVLWVIGIKLDYRYKVCESTKKIIKFELLK